MNITPPIGYEQIIPLSKEHRVRLQRVEEVPPGFHRMHAMPLSLAEFRPASRDYPIVFVSGEAKEPFTAVGVLGLQGQQNLFVMTDGSWDRRAYLPAYVRRYPFCMAKVTMNGELLSERLVCVENAAIGEKGETLYDSEGQAQPHWAALEKLIFDYENDLARSEELCKLLVECKLLEPFSMKAEIDGFTMQLEGMHRVSEEALAALDDEQLRRLLSAGVLEKIYAHLVSLDNFHRLLNRRSFFALKAPAKQQDLN